MEGGPDASQDLTGLSPSSSCAEGNGIRLATKLLLTLSFAMSYSNISTDRERM